MGLFCQVYVKLRSFLRITVILIVRKANSLTAGYRHTYQALRTPCEHVEFSPARVYGGRGGIKLEN